MKSASPTSASTASAARSPRLEALALGLLAGGLVVGVWHLSVKLSGTRVFPSPGAVLAGLGELVRKGLLLRYIGDSMLRVGVGYGLAVLLGVPLGLLMGRHAWLGELLNPLLQVLRPISPLAWIPVAIVLFGVSNASTIFLIFLTSIFPITLAAMNGVHAVPDIYLRAGHNFGLSPAAQLWRVLLPAALPQLLTGLRLALGVAWLVVVAAEMVAVDSGLGYLITDSRSAGKRYDLVVAGMLLIGLIGLALDTAMRQLEGLKAVCWGFRAR
jgi:NitT/TauT family transport system permease protein